MVTLPRVRSGSTAGVRGGFRTAAVMRNVASKVLGESIAQVSSDTRAFIGARDTATAPASPANRVTVSGDVTVTAIADLVATARLDGASGSILATGQNFRPVATVSGDVSAYAGEGADIQAGSVTIRTAEGTDPSDVQTERKASSTLTSFGFAVLGSDGRPSYPRPLKL